MKPLLDFSGKSKACCGVTDLEGLSVLASSPEKGNLLSPVIADRALLTLIMFLHSTSATGGAIDNKIEQAMDLVKSHLLFAVREEVEVLKEQIQELVEKNEQLQRENSLLRQHQPQGIPHLPYSQAETPKATMHVSTTAGTQDQTGFPGMPGGAPRTDGFTQQQPNPTEQFGGMQAAGGPTHGQAPTQQQTLPQQQAGQYVHIQPQPPLSQPLQVQPLQTQPLQTPHSIPQQTTTQHAKPPSQT